MPILNDPRWVGMDGAMVKTGVALIFAAVLPISFACGNVVAVSHDGGDADGRVSLHSDGGSDLADHPGAGGTGGQAGAKLSGPGGAGGNTLTGTGGIGGSISETGGTTGSGEMAGAPGAGGGAGQGSLLLGPNLITNGDFSNGQNGWLLTAPAGSGITVSVTDGQLCVSFPSGTYQEATVGWPADPTQAVALPLGESFQFSFQASSAPSLTQFGDLVGPATGSSGSTSDFQSTNDALFGGIQMFSHPFTSRGDSAAGVAFNMNSFGAAATVCFDNVALQQIEGVSS